MQTTKVHQDLIGKSYNEIVAAIKIDEDNGGCCGYAQCDEVSAIPSHVSTDALVLKDCVEIEYDERDEDRKVLNFVFTDGEGELILGYELRAGSGSGWSYGAWVSLSLEDREICGASW